MDAHDVLKLAELARLRLSPEEAAKLSHEFDAILSYVGEVKDAAVRDVSRVRADVAVRNVMREDGEGHEPGIYTEKILELAPERKGNYIRVKKIL